MIYEYTRAYTGTVVNCTLFEKLFHPTGGVRISDMFVIDPKENVSLINHKIFCV